MKKSILMLLVMSILFSFSMNSCKKDDKKSDSPADLPKPSIASGAQVVKVPEALQNNQNPGAQQCAAYINMVNGFSAWAGLFAVPDNATQLKSTGTRNYKWSNGTETVYYEYTETSDKNTWTMYFQDASHPKTKVVYAEEAKTGKSGKVEVYDWENNSTLEARWSWTKDDSNNVNFIFEDTQNGDTITINVKADGSGTINIVVDGIKRYSGSWSAAGHGSFITYDEKGTTVTTYSF